MPTFTFDAKLFVQVPIDAADEAEARAKLDARLSSCTVQLIDASTTFLTASLDGEPDLIED